MTDYQLGRAHGSIEIDYSGDGADKADAALQRVSKSSAEADASLSKTGKTLQDTDRQMSTSGSAASGYGARLREVRQASDEVGRAEKDYQGVLRDSKSSLDDIEQASDRVVAAKKQHAKATTAERDEHRALTSELNIGQRAIHALSDVIPNLKNRLTELGTTQTSVADKSNLMAKALGGAGKAAALLGPEGEAAAAGLEVAAKGMDKLGGSATAGAGHVRDFIKDIASFEMAFGKISGLTLALPSVGGLAGLGGASALQGIVEMVEAARQLSGVLGLLPAAISGAAFSMGTLKIAFHGVGDAIKDMMADDPKKFLEDIKNMGPAAAHSMLQIAQFRDQFKMAGGAIQDSFFSKIANDIAPLIQTWLPAVTAGMSKVAGIFGDFAHQFAGILQQPQVMAAFTQFIDNMAQGLQAMQPAIAPLVGIFTQLTVVGSSFFGQVGGNITALIQQFGAFINKAASDGSLQQWIQTGINAFGHLVHIVENVGSSFMTIMNIADKFGGGGLLGWLEKVTAEFDKWTQSAEGQKTLTDFFSTLRTATDAFLPMLKPLVEGLASIGQAFVQLGIGIAPGWQTFFNTFAQTMQQLGPQLVAIGPSLNQFLTGMAGAFAQLMAQVGPQLPQIFSALASAFVALLPQIGPIVDAFIQLVEGVGPQLPSLFQAVTDALNQLTPLLPTIIELFADFVAVVTKIVDLLGGAIGAVTSFGDALNNLGKYVQSGLSGTWDALSQFFGDLPNKAEQWGMNLIQGLVRGMTNSMGLAGQGAKSIVDGIASWFQQSPAKQGPFSGAGYTMVRGKKMVQDMAAGMVSAQGSIESAAAGTAAAAAGGLSGGTGGGGGGASRAATPGGAEGLGGALLPDNIASADTSILSAYLRHQFDDSRGLKGFAKDFGNLLSGLQSGVNAIAQQGLQQVFQTMTSLPGGNQQSWRKMSPKDFQAQQQEEMQRKAMENANKQGPTWGDLNIPNATGAAGGLNPGVPSASLSDALKAKGFSAQQIRLVQAFSQIEGNNPAGNPTLGFTDSQLGGAADLQSHVNALAKQFVDRSSVAGAFPEGGTDLQQAQWIAKVVGQSGLSSDWQGNAQPQDYVQRVMKAMGPAGGTGPSWPQVTGGGAGGAGASVPMTGLPPGAKVGADGSISVPHGVALPTGPGGIAENPASQAMRVPNAPNVEAGIKAIGGLPSTLYPTSGPGAYQVPAWAQQLAQAFGLTASTYANGGSLHQMGYAFDFNDPDAPNGPSARKDAFAQFISSNLAQQTLQLIYRGQKDYTLASGKNVAGSYYADDLPGHTDHVHFATDVPVLLNGQVPPGSMATALGAGSTPYGDVNNALGVLQASQGAKPSVNDQMLQQYLATNPGLAGQIAGAQTPGASDQQVQSTLNSIDTTITGLKAQDAVGNKNTIDALQSSQQQIAQNAGFQQGANPMQLASSMLGAGSNAVSGVIQAFQGGLDALSATQDTADRLVYGIRNTEDVNKLIDNFQKYITFAADVANATGSILSMAGSASGGADFGGTAAAGQVAQLISGLLQGVNAAIDFGQQAYQIAGSYVGRFLSQLTGGASGTPLMGDVRFLLNKNTNQLISYSEDNPGNQNTQNVPGFLQGTYDSGNGQNPNPSVNTQFNIYGGPSMSASDAFNHVSFLTATGGTSGAMAAANF